MGYVVNTRGRRGRGGCAFVTDWATLVGSIPCSTSAFLSSILPRVRRTQRATHRRYLHSIDELHGEHAFGTKMLHQLRDLHGARQGSDKKREGASRQTRMSTSFRKL
eukprot:750862-Hanusia_phi.AAC.3